MDHDFCAILSFALDPHYCLWTSCFFILTNLNFFTCLKSRKKVLCYFILSLIFRRKWTPNAILSFARYWEEIEICSGLCQCEFFSLYWEEIGPPFLCYLIFFWTFRRKWTPISLLFIFWSAKYKVKFIWDINWFFCMANLHLNSGSKPFVSIVGRLSMDTFVVLWFIIFNASIVNLGLFRIRNHKKSKTHENGFFFFHFLFSEYWRQ